jgi:hypothetical protein
VTSFIRIALLLAASLTLSGCLTSTRPLFEPASGVALLGNGGRYQLYEATSSGYKRDEIVTIRRVANGYRLINEKGHADPVTFHKLSDGRTIAQFQDDSGRYGYAAIRVHGATVLSYTASCAKQDLGKLAALGVEERGEECVLDRVNDPAALFAAVKFEQKPAKLVRLRQGVRTRR